MNKKSSGFEYQKLFFSLTMFTIILGYLSCWRLQWVYNKIIILEITLKVVFIRSIECFGKRKCGNFKKRRDHQQFWYIL